MSVHRQMKRPRQGTGVQKTKQQDFLVYSNGVNYSSGERMAFLTVNGSNVYQLLHGRWEKDSNLTVYIETSSLSSPIPRVK